MPKEREIANFLSAIAGEAEQRRQRLEKESRKYIAAELEKAEAEAKENMEKQVARRAALLRSDLGRAYAAALLEERKSLFAYRDCLKTEIFHQAEEKLRAFAQSAEYADFLTKALASALDTLGPDATVYLRGADEPCLEKLRQTAPCATFLWDDSLTLGGLVAKSANGRGLVDHSIKHRLQAQQDWFLQACGYWL